MEDTINRYIATAALAAIIAATGATSLPGPAKAGANVVCKPMTLGYGKRPVRAIAKLLAHKKLARPCRKLGLTN